ncbi:multicopper oxidase family protein [Rhizohabitans arisaemae]|uniref:multicopper oxidase family protein n=1 Tax=Rhizohabitans arisaemae TaxID=2720610 RepID=UPI0024B0D4F3|nr:multicopper oxidase domain-containing protein [Rhizohabitans arisaemae]
MTRPRRQFLALAGGLSLAGAGFSGCSDNSGGRSGTRPGGSTGSGSGSQEEDEDNEMGALVKSRTALPRPFQVPLPIPPVLRPVRTDGTTDHYELTQQVKGSRIIPGHTTMVWGYNGVFPGPTIESRSGRTTVVRHRNTLPRPVSVHLHGGRTPAEHDGYPLDLVAPVGGSIPRGHGHAAMTPTSVTQGQKDYVYPMDQRAATLWYHDHRMDFTGPQVYKGLAGFHLVRDDVEDALPLPKGDKDIPLMIVDRSFDEDGQFLYPSLDPKLASRPGVKQGFMDGVLGDVVLVNGAPWPVLEVEATRYRFRLLNASNARIYRLTLSPQPSGGDAFVQIGGDGGLLEAPVRHDQVELAPGERYDVVVDFSRYPVGTKVTMGNSLGTGETVRVMRFDVARKAREESTVPSRLSRIERLDPAKAVTRRRFEFVRGDVGGMRGWTVNGEAFHPDKVLARPKLNSVEVWEFRASAISHPVHLHLAHFQVVSRRGRRPGPYDSGWKDTLNLKQSDTAEVVVRFTGYRGRFVFHCHNLEHEDMAMMANFDVV